MEDMQGSIVQTAALERQVAEAQRGKVRLEGELSQLLRDRSEVEERCAALLIKGNQVDQKDVAIGQLQQQVSEQSEQLDALVAELGHPALPAARVEQERDEAELRRQISELRAANARLEAKGVDAQNVFDHHLDRLRQQHRAGGDGAGDDDAEELRVQVARLQAALEVSQKSMARTSVQDLRDKDDIIARLQAQMAERQGERQPAHGSQQSMRPPLSPDSLGTITLVESDTLVQSDIDSGSGSVTQEALSHQSRLAHAVGAGKGGAGDGNAAHTRHLDLEEKLAQAVGREEKMRVQLGRLERIQKSAQGTALAQEQHLHHAVRAMGHTSETLQQTTAGLSLEVEEWRVKAQSACKDAAKSKARAEEAMAQLTQYDAAVVGLEKELAECKGALLLYHDRIVALAGAEDKVVKEKSKWNDYNQDKGVLPLSSHLKATNKLGQQYAAEKRHLERSLAISGKALDAVRAELLQCQTLRAQENHQWDQRVREQAGALQEMDHRLRSHRDDGVVRVQELERTVRMLSTKSDTHKTLANVSSEVAQLRTSEQRLKNDVEFLKQRAATAEHENKSGMERVVALQCRLNSVQLAPGGSEQLVTTMSEQIEVQEGEVERLEGLLRVAKEQYDVQAAHTLQHASHHNQQLSATQLVADAHERRVLELQADLQALEDKARLSSEADTDCQDRVRRSLAQKAAADKVAQGLTEQLAEAEEKLVLMRANLADKEHLLASKHVEQVAVLQDKIAQSTRACQRLQLQLSQLEAQAQEGKARMHSLGAQLQTARDDKEQALGEARQSDTRARQAQDLAARENERLQHNLSNASAQLTVLMDTIETLQGATTAQQRVATLTTKLSAAQAVELQLQLCNSQLHHELEDRVWQCGQLQTSVATLKHHLSTGTQKLAAAQATLEV